MFILRMIFRSFSRQFRRRLLVAITICLSSAVATAMLGVVFDVGDKLNEELSAYGSNIVIEPKSDAVVADLYETVDGSDTEPTSFLKESDIQKIKTIFWAYNITNFAPKLNLHADITAGTGGDAATVPVVGTWFNTTLHLATGETSVVGVQGMRSWWTVNGRWARDDADEAMIGADLADQLHIDAPGMTITLSRGNTAATVTVVGIYDSGDEENGAVYVPSATLQELSGLTDSVDEVEVKALTTPENDLARKVSRNPRGRHPGGMGNLVLHRLRLVDRLPDRGGAPRRRGQTDSPDLRTARRCTQQDSRGHDRHDRPEPARRSHRRGEPDGRLDHGTVLRTRAAQGDRSDRRRGVAAHAVGKPR